MTGLLMTGLFDFLSYAIGISRTHWRLFAPALLISVLISDSILVAVGAGVAQGASLTLGLALLAMFALATVTGLIEAEIGQRFRNTSTMSDQTASRNALLKMLSGSFSNQQQAFDNPLYAHILVRLRPAQQLAPGPLLLKQAYAIGSKEPYRIRVLRP